MADILHLAETGTCRLLVGTRPWTEFNPLLNAARQQGKESLVDLDQVPAAKLREDLRLYVTELLQGARHYAPDYDMRLRIAQVIAAALTDRPVRFGSEYLAAGVFVDYLDTLPAVINELRVIRNLVPASLDRLLEMRLATLGMAQPWLRPVLAALAHAKGTGMPRSIVTPAAATFAPASLPWSQDSEAAVATALETAQFYLRSNVDTDGTVLYRLYHQALDDHLRAHPVDPEHSSGPPADAMQRLFNNLLSQLRLQTTNDHAPYAWDRAEPYLLRHAIQHAADAGRVDKLLQDHDFLVHADSETIQEYLDGAKNKRSKLYAAVYRTSHGKHRFMSPGQRRRILALDAVRWGDADLARHLNRAPWIARWATGSKLASTCLATLVC